MKWKNYRSAFLAVLTVGVAASVALEWMVPAPMAGEYLSELEPIHELAVEKKFDQAGTIFSWAIGTMGAALLLFKFEIEGDLLENPTRHALIFCTVCLSLSSILFGNLLEDRLILYLAHHKYPLNDWWVNLLTTLQFLSLLCALISVAAAYLLRDRISGIGKNGD